MMRELLLMSAPAEVETRDAVGIEILQELVKQDPQITWDEYFLAVAQIAENADGSMDGWFTDLTRGVGNVLNTVTGGLAGKIAKQQSKMWSDIISKTFGGGKIKDSLDRAASGVRDDMLSNFLDALPFGLGRKLKVGEVFDRFWLIGILAAAVVVYFVFIRKKGRK